MAQSVKLILADDLESGPADGTAHFGLDGRQYEIDLFTANAEKLREALRPYAAAGRRTQSKSTRATGPRSFSGGNPETARIRAWVKETATRSPTTAVSTSPSRTPTTPPSRPPLPHR